MTKTIAVLGFFLVPSLLFAHTVNLPASLVATGTTVQNVVTTGLQTPEGPVCDSAGNLFFSDHHNFSHTTGVIWEVPVGQAAKQIKQNLDVPCGMVIDRQQQLVFGGWQTLSQFAPPSGATTVLASGDSLREVNDLTLASDGGIFFTADLWDSSGYVYYRSSAGALKKVLSYAGGTGASFPNGIEYIEERHQLYVGVSQKNQMLRYTVDAQNIPASPVTFASIQNPDGIAIDEACNVWVAEATNGISVFDSTGTLLGNIHMDANNATNCAFGGVDRKTLYITSGTGVYSVSLLVKGRRTDGVPPTEVISASPRYVSARTATPAPSTIVFPGFATAQKGLFISGACYSMTGRLLAATARHVAVSPRIVTSR